MIFASTSRTLCGIIFANVGIRLASPVRCTESDRGSSSVQFHKSSARLDVDPAGSWPELRLPRILTRVRSRPWDSVARPLAACRDDGYFVNNSTDVAETSLAEAVSTFCSAGLGSMIDLYVDPKFERRDRRFRDNKGWLREAFVTYVGLRNPHDDTAEQMDLLLQSIHHFSTRPVVVVNFGRWVPMGWKARFPRMILIHGRKMLQGHPFNLNKIRAMSFTKVRTGVALDADQWVNSGIDVMFRRAAEETTEKYKFPILPVHWMSRDPESDDTARYSGGGAGYGTLFRFKLPSAPRRTMRWGHAHPTWTHYALGFFTKWLSYELAPQETGAPGWLTAQGNVSDEPLMNMALWAENATKQWCKFDTPSTWMFSEYVMQTSGDSLAQRFGNEFADDKWYPHGIPLIFYSVHGAKHPAETFRILDFLRRSPDVGRRAFVHNGTWFASWPEVRRQDPGLRCLM